MDSESVLAHWLGVRDDTSPDAARVSSWFVVDPVADREIKTRFGVAVEDAIAGGLMEWEADPVDRVALILLLDQFPRNLFRGTTRAFAGDLRAIELARRTTDEELGRLHPLERYFAIMPWMHTENLEDERAGEAAYARAAGEVAEVFRPLFENGLAFATRHRVVIERFGRFPHRNEVLGRSSTADERVFLEANVTGF